jgi:hypothetical protein
MGPRELKESLETEPSYNAIMVTAGGQPFCAIDRRYRISGVYVFTIGSFGGEDYVV